jgi:hypothetical protein
VAILTGFPCLLDRDPPTENDGLAGAVSLARAVCVLGREAVLVTDDVNEAILRRALAADPVTHAAAVQVLAFPPKSRFGPEHDERLRALASASAAVVGIERTGVASDGCYYTMRGYDMSHLVAPLDRLFEYAALRDGGATPTIAIGDGGNEVGMGNVLLQVRAHIKLGEKIACTTTCDHLIVASVSNWGGYALVAAMALVAEERGLLSSCQDAVARMLPSIEEETHLHGKLVEMGVVDGTNREAWCVDGMPFDTSMRVLEELRAICLKDSHL